MKDKKVLKIYDTDGNIKEYEIILTFIWSKNQKNYIVYTDNTNTEDGKLNLYAAIYYPDDDTKLEEIETEEEWDLIEENLRRIQVESGDNYDNSRICNPLWNNYSC